MAIYSIYRLTNLVNGKVYIGKTRRDPEVRLREHRIAAEKNSPHPIHRALRKYGIEQFKYEVIYNAFTEFDLNEAEIMLIKEHQCCLLDADLGYNATRGGDNFDEDFARANNRRKVAEGRHHFQGKAGSELSKRTNRERLEAGTHHWQGPEYSQKLSKRNRDLIEAGKHPWAGENGRHTNLKRIAAGTHNLAGDAGSKLQRAKLSNGSHHSQVKHTCPHCQKVGGGNRFKGSHFQKCKSRP